MQKTIRHWWRKLKRIQTVGKIYHVLGLEESTLWKQEVKLSQFADDMIWYIEKPKDATGKILELINESVKVAGYKIDAQKSLAFLYTNDEKYERKIKETLFLPLQQKE